MIGCIDQRGARQELTFKTLSCNLGSKTYIIGGSLDSTLPNSRIKAGSKTARSDIVESMVGDVAHSFNNLLSIVSGHAAILQESADLENNVSFESIHQSVADGATLIKQLNRLTITKPNQAETLNLGQYIEQMQVMIKLAIGRSLSLSMLNNNGYWQCLINPAKYEYALIKLCLNGKETSPAGDTLSITIEQFSQQSKDIKTYGLMAAEYTKLSIVVCGSDGSEEIAKLILIPSCQYYMIPAHTLKKSPRNTLIPVPSMRYF